MKKKENANVNANANQLTNDILPNDVLIVRAFMQIKESNLHAADKWWLLNEFNHWLEAQREINRLYGYKPSNWISDSRKWSLVKMKSMRNIVIFMRDYYARQGDADSPGSGYYAFLDRLFGKGKWDDIEL